MVHTRYNMHQKNDQLTKHCNQFSTIPAVLGDTTTRLPEYAMEKRDVTKFDEFHRIFGKKIGKGQAKVNYAQVSKI